MRVGCNLALSMFVLPIMIASYANDWKPLIMDVIDSGKGINYEAFFHLIRRYIDALLASIDTPLSSIPWYVKLMYVAGVISDLFT
jgi:hypothetical protein